MLDIGLAHRNEYDLEPGQPSLISIAEAPGRVHFLGEQGGLNAGLFLSAAIDRYVRVAVSARKDNSLRFFAADLGERKRSTLINLKYKREDRWANYLKVAIQVFADLGFPVRGLNFTVAGNIPQQIALASSTAMEIAAAMALRGFFNAQLTKQDLVKKLVNTHTVMFGKAVLFVDYLIGLFARKDQFLLVDELSQSIVKKIKSPLSRYQLFFIDSRVPRMGEESELDFRLADIQKGLTLLCQKQEGASFRDFATTDLMEVMGDFPEKIRRRSMHIVQEFRRIYDAGDALERKELAAFARIIINSHESLRDLYEVSCPEVDWLVKRAQEADGAAAARMTGHGFGGCTYAFIRSDMQEEYKKRLEDYERIFGFRPIVYQVKPASGSRLISVQERVHADIAY